MFKCYRAWCLNSTEVHLTTRRNVLYELFVDTLGLSRVFPFELISLIFNAFFIFEMVRPLRICCVPLFRAVLLAACYLSFCCCLSASEVF